MRSCMYLLSSRSNSVPTAWPDTSCRQGVYHVVICMLSFACCHLHADTLSELCRYMLVRQAALLHHHTCLIKNLSYKHAKHDAHGLLHPELYCNCTSLCFTGLKQIPCSHTFRNGCGAGRDDNCSCCNRTCIESVHS